MKKFFFKSLAIGLLALLPAIVSAQECVTVGTGTSADRNYPMGNWYNYAWTQTFYPASLINHAAGNIESISYYCSAGGPLTTTLKIYMGLTTKTKASSTTDWVAASDLTLVYSKTGFSFPTSAGWLEIPLDQKFAYDGESNIVVCVSRSGSYNSSIYFRYTTGESGVAMNRQNDSYSTYADHPGSSSGTMSTYRANIQFCFPASCNKPKSLSTSDISSETATISWTAGGTETKWQYVYGEKGFTPDWSNPSSVNTASVTLDGLDANIEYDFYVRAYCSDVDQSGAVKKEFKTTCEPITITKESPFTEGFEEGWSSFKDCWNRQTYTSGSYTYPYVYNYGAKSGSKLLNFYGGLSTSITMVVLPIFSNKLDTLQLEFWYKQNGINSTNPQFIVGTMSDPNDFSTFHQMEALSRVSDYTYYAEPITLSDVAALDKYIAIRFANGSYYTYGYIDDIKVRIIPTCKKPTNLTVGTLTSGSAVLSWTKGAATDSKWQVMYKRSAEGSWTTIENVTANPYTLTDLEANTSYNVKVCTDCGEQGVSDDSDVKSFTTPCAAISSDDLPWKEDFEGMTANTIPTCWDNSSSTTTTTSGNNKYYVWGVYSYGGNKMIRMYNYSVQSGTALINTPSVVLPSEGEYVLNFLYTHNATCGDFKVQISDNGGQSFTTLKTFSKNPSSQDKDNPGEFTKESISLASYKGKTITIQFYTNANNGYGAIFVDDVTIKPAPTCVEPTGLTSSTITANSATIKWTKGGTEGSWLVQYAKTGSPAWTILPDAVTADSVILTNLEDATSYDVQVRAICSESDTSEWSATYTFMTACGKKEITKDKSFTENFDSWATGSAAEFGTCWNRITYTSYSTSYPYCSSSGAKSGSNCMYFYGGTSSSMQYLVLPEFETELNKLHIEFYYHNYGTTATYGQFVVGTMSNPADASTFHPLDTLDRYYYYFNYKQYAFDLENATVGDTYIAIKYFNGTSSYASYIDDIIVSKATTCFTPTGLAPTETTTTSITVGWTAGKDEDHWIVQHKLASEGDNAWVADTVDVNSLIINNLYPSTNYQVRVQAYCGIDDESVMSSAIDVATACAVLPYNYSTNFESMPTGKTPQCWNKPSGGTATVVSESSKAQSGTKTLKFAGDLNNVVVMPEFNKETNLLQVTFWSRPEDAKENCGSFSVGYVTDANDTTTFVALETYTYEDGVTPIEYEVGMGSAPAGARIAFRHNPKSANWFWFVDDVSVDTLPSCIKPAINDPILTSTSAAFTWTAGKDEGQWLYVNVAKGTDPDWNNATLVDNTAATITGLSANTQYDFYLRAYCGGTDTSKVAKYQYRTECAELVFNHVYGFEDDEAGKAPMCWSVGKEKSGGSNPTTVQDTVYSKEGDMSLKMDYTSYSGKIYAVMPKVPESIDVSTLEVSAYARTSANSGSFSAMEVGVMDGPTDYSSFVRCSNNNDNSLPLRTTKNYAVSTIKLSGYSGTGKYIAFVLTEAKTAYLDNISVVKKLDKPRNIQVVAGSTSADVTFEQYNSKGKWEYELNGVVCHDTLKATSFTLNGLTSSTNYTLRIHHIDDAKSEVSDWTSVNFATTCGVQTLPYFQDFSVGALPACWDTVGAPTFNGDLYMANKAIAFMPAFDFDSIEGMTNAKVAFTINASKPIRLIAVADPSTITWENLDSEATVLFEGLKSGNMELYLGDVVGLDETKPYIGFCTDSASTYAQIDDVEVSMAWARVPSDVAVPEETITDSTAVVTFNQLNNDEAGWEYQVSATSSFAGADTVYVDNMEAPYSFTISGLQQAATYKVRMRQASDTIVDHWSAVVSFTTPCARLKYAPFTYTFEEETLGQVPFCWNYDASVGYEPKVVKAKDSATDSIQLMIPAGNLRPGMVTMPQVKDGEDISLLTVQFTAKTTNVAQKLKVGVVSSADDMSDFTALQTITLTDENAVYAASLEMFEGDETFVAFYSGATDGDNDTIYIDDVQITRKACKDAKPSVSNITTSSADLSCGVEDIAWEYKVGEEGAVISVAANTSVSLSSLEDDSEYELFVRMACSETAKSEWKSITFRTKCLPQVALDYEMDLTSGIPTCAKAIDATWVSGEVSMGSAALVFPVFESTTDYEGLQLTFTARHNGDKPALKIIAYDEAVETLASQVVLATVEAPAADGQLDVYFSEIEDINTKLAGKRLGIYRAEGALAFVKGISIKAESQFKAPTNLAVDAQTITADGADFTFDQPGVATNAWVVEVAKEDEFTTLVKTMNITEQSFTLAGMRMKTKYYVRVKQMNGEQSSGYSNVVMFETECGTLTLDSVYSFEDEKAGTSYSVSYQPNCWGYNAGYSSYEPFVCTGKGVGASKAMRMQGYSESNPTLFTLPVAGEDVDMSKAVITFWAMTPKHVGMNIYVGVMDDAKTYSAEGLKAQTIKVTNQMTQYTVCMSNVEGVTEDFKYVAFVLPSSSTSDTVYVDNIQVSYMSWTAIRSGLNNAQLGTVCQGKDIQAVRGGVLYGVDYGTTSEVEFLEKQLPIAAGEPLLFQADGTNGGKLEVVYGSQVSDTARHDATKEGVNGLVGRVSGANVGIEAGNILVSGGRLRIACTGCELAADHAYIMATELPAQKTSAPGRRLVLTQQGANVVTDMVEVFGSEDGAFKFVRDGQMFILREGKLFNAQGQVVK